MQGRRVRIVAALIGILLAKAGGCARSEFNLQRPSREAEPSTARHAEHPVETAQMRLPAGGAMPKRLPPTNERAGAEQAGQLSVAMTAAGRLPLPRGAETDGEQFDPQLDAAFQRLHQASTMMPLHVPSARNHEVPPPPAARVASPFAKPGQQQPDSVRSIAR